MVCPGRNNHAAIHTLTSLMRQKSGTNPEVSGITTRQINGLVFHGDQISDVLHDHIIWSTRAASAAVQLFDETRLVVGSE